MALTTEPFTTEQLSGIGESQPTGAELADVWRNVIPEKVEGGGGGWGDEKYGAFDAGVDQAQGLGFRFVQMVGDMFDIKEWEESGREGAEENFKISSAYKRQALLETEGMGDFQKWITDTVQTQIPMMLPSLAAGGVGGFIAAWAGLGAAATAAAVGTAAYIPNFVLNSGEAYSKQLEAKGNIDAETAAMTGALAAVLDTIIPGKIAGKIFNQGKKSFPSHVAKKLADGSAVGDRWRQGWKFALAEGGTEGLQEAIMQMSRDYVNDKAYGFTKADREEIIEGVAAGFLMGKGFGWISPTGKGKAVEQVRIEDEFKAAKEEATSRIRDDRDAAIEAINDRTDQSNKADVKASEKEIRALKNEARDKLKSLGRTKTISDIEKIVPPIKEEAAPTPEALQEELGTVEQRLTEAKAELETEVAKPRGRAPNRKAIRLKEEIASLEARKIEIATQLEETASTTPAATPEAAPPITPPTDEQVPTTPITTEPEEPAQQPYTPTGPEFFTQLDEQIAQQEAAIAETEAQLAQPIEETSAFNKRRIVTQLKKRLAEQKVERDRLLAMQKTPDQIAWSDVARQEPPPEQTLDQRLGKEEDLALREAERQNLEQQGAAQAEARAKAQADAEDAAAAAAQAEAQRIADEEAALGDAAWGDVAVQDKPLIDVIPPGSSTTNQDIALADARSRQQEARKSALSLRLNKARQDRLEAERIKREEVAQQAAERREEAAQRREQEQRTRINDERKAAADARAEERAVAEAERKRKAEDAKEQAEFEKRETNKTVAEAQASASETIAEFETRPLTISEMKAQMRVRGNKIGDADRIGASEAKAEYLDTVRKGINEIDSARVAAATAEKAKAATAPKAAPATEKKPDDKPTAPVTEGTEYGADPSVLADEAPQGEAFQDPSVLADAAPPVISSPRDAIDSVKDGKLEPDQAIDALAEAMNTDRDAAESAFVDEATQEDNQAMVEAGEKRGSVSPGTTAAVKDEAKRVAATQAAKPKGKAGDAVKAGVAAQPDTRKKKKSDKKGQSTFTQFRRGRDGKSWTARIAGAPAKITMDEVGEYHTTYDKISNPIPFTTLPAAKISLLKTHGTPQEQKKIRGREPAAVAKTKTTTVETKPKKQKWAKDTDNSAGVPVRIDYDPTLDKEKPHIVMVRGEPYKRYAKRDRARYVANRVTDAQVERALLAIQKRRLKEQEGGERGAARVAAAKERGLASQPDRAGVVLKPPRMALTAMPLPTLSEKKKIKNPNVKIDSELEREVIEEATDLDGNSITVSYEERDLTKPDAQKSTSFRKSEVSIARFNTFTPFMVSTKEEAQAISASIYANPEIFHVFLGNEISTRAGLDPKIVSMGVINDQEALKMQQSYQRRVDKLYNEDKAGKRLTDEQRDDIARWRKKIKDLNTNDGRNYKSTVVPGATQADFDESLQRWVDFLDDKGKDTGPIRDFLDTKKKVDEEVAVAVVEDQNPDDTLYHITRTEDVESIIEDGIQRFGGARAATNWLDDSGARMGKGEVYSFDNRDEALKWAQKMEWEVYDSHDTGKISIVSHRRGEDWGVDENVGTEEPQGLFREEGVDPEDIIEAEVFVFGNMGGKFQAVAGATFKTERTITPGKAVSVEIRDNIDLFFEALAEDPESISTEFMEEMVDVYTDGGKDADYLMDKNGEFKSEFGREGLEQTPDGDWILKVSPELQYRWEFDQGPVLMEDTPSEVAYNNPAEFLYHVTPTAFVAKIKKEGIKSSRDRGGLEYAPGVADSIHVADNIQDARSFAKFLNSGIGKSGASWKADEIGAVSIIKVTNDGSQLYLDPNRGKTREDKKWLIRKESISPNDIVSVEPYNASTTTAKSAAISLNEQAKQAWYSALDEAGVTEIRDESLDVLDDEGNILFEGYRTEYNKETEKELSEAEFDRLFGYSIAEEQSALDRQYAKERADRKKGKSTDKVSVDSILANENPADLHSKLTTPPSQNGYSVDEVKSLAANIKALNPDFNYNPKGKKEDIAASIMEWYVSPMEDAYTKNDLTETKENDDVVESRRLNKATTFHSPGQAEKLVRSQVRSIFGDKGARRLEEIGFINFIDRNKAKDMGASDTAQAFVSRGNGTIYFIRDKISSDMTAKDVRGLLFHEVGVHFGRDVFSGSEWNSVLDELYKLGQNGDDIVNTAVARVMRNYGYKKADTGRPFDPAAKHINFHVRREFWEEVLAHVVEIKQPALDSPSRKGLLDKIKNAFKTFFNKVFGTDMNVSNVTLDDIVNLIGYSTWHSGILALERHGDSKNMSRFRDGKRKEFLDGSIMKEPVYHGTSSDWSAPLIEKTQLGLHVGTSIAAVNISASEHFRDKPIQESEALAELADEVEAWKPGWESRISNRDLDKIAISWDPKLRLRTSDNLADAQGLFDSLGMQKEVGYTWFEKGANIRRGYINVQNPFITGDLGNFSDPTSWFTHANRVLRGDAAYNSPEAQEVVWEKISKLARSTATTRRSLHDESDIAGMFSLDAKFSRELRALLKEEGYDSIEYTNDAEDVGSKSWILLDDNQYKSVDDLSFDSGTGIFSTKKVISQPNSSAITESRRLERETAREVVKSRIGTARANSALKWMQRRIEPLMAVEGYSLLEAKRMLTKGKVGEWANTGRIVFDVLNEATPTEKKAIYKYFTTRNADPSKLPTRKVKFAEHKTVVRGTRAGPTAPSVSIKEKVIETKKEIASMGERLVAAGLITDAQYAEWKNQYLPRVYMEHVMGGRDRIGIGGLRASSLTYTKHRKDHEKFLNDVISGRIDDPAFLAGRYLTMAGSDLAIIEYLSYIASDPGNNKWVLPGQIMTFRNMIGTAAYFKNLASDISTRANAGKRIDPARAAEMLELSSEMNAAADQVSVDMRGLNMDNYRKVPDSPRYGAMRELWVHKDIWNDINGLGITGNPSWGALLKWSGRAQATFKYTKVPMNIPTQVRNMISNTILMNVSGTNFLRIPGAVSKAMHDVSTNGKYMQLARKYGLETTTFAATELGQIDRELATVKAKGDSFEGMWARARIFFNDYGDVGGRAYQKTEVLFKVAKMIDLMENHGKKEAEAAKLANEALLDYGNVSQGIRMLRTLPLGSPFITFNAKVMAQMARNIKNHPFASLKYAALPYLLMEMFLSQNDDLDEDDWDALMDFLPDYMEKEFSTMVFPYKDENNRWKAWDVSFFLPWGAHTALAKNVAKAEFGDAIYSSIGMFTGPAEIPVALKLNKDPFTRQPIYNEFDPVHQRYQDMMMFVASYMIPPMIMPRNKAGDISTGGGPLIKTMMAADIIDGNVDRDGLPRYTMKDATLAWFGVSLQKMGPQDVDTALHFKEREIRKIEQRAERMLSDPSLSREKRERLANEYREHILKIIQEHRKWAESLKRFKRLF